MAQKKIPQTLKRVIYSYIGELKNDKLPIQNVILFGSYAKGTPHASSDVDLCVVSPEFSDYVDAIQYLLSRRQLNLRYPIEPIGIHPRDFKDNTPLIIEIKRTGIKIL